MNPRLALLALFVSLALITIACGSGDDDSTTAVDGTDTIAEPGADGGGTDSTSTDGADDDTAPDDGDAGPGSDAGSDAADGSDPGYTVRNVPADYPTIQAAVDAAEPGDLVLIHEGVYNEAVVVQTDNIVIRGIDRNAVILDGQYAEIGSENGIIISANGVAVENLTIRGYTRNGLFWTGDYGNDFFVDGYRASYVTVHNVGVYGIYAFNALNGQFDHTYASGSDDSSYYVGQCRDCNALLYEVEATNSQLGYSGTNSSGTIITKSHFHNNMIGVVTSSLSSEQLAPNTGTIIVGNYIHDNNNEDVPSRNHSYQLGLGTGVVLAGTVENVVERNRIVNNTRAGVTTLDWIAAILGGKVDYPAIGNIVRDNIIFGSTLDADLMLALESVEEGGQQNCYYGNTFDNSTPADIEVSLSCDNPTNEGLVPLDQLIAKFNIGFDPIDYRDAPVPEYNFDNMPGDPATDPPRPAVDVPMEIDLDSIGIPPAG
ncbi:MAG: hypothetical protein F4Y27_08615 [Acidimicrobiaceae bacterium]|nr:hypothetical protein [Acidimicrobiaceae bacterium]MYA74724.1 hypothetical protein [Acidimicrobiaceae bacterium]MYC42861.1 hypothetical protein [Acidimicrobiaceae bacterium]MYG54435.1 hypothetical protein [Acidimicrobiaceae bacterium]MYH87326.1 hypothetical protein [Acidimicrobiaceae bacterium]